MALALDERLTAMAGQQARLEKLQRRYNDLVTERRAAEAAVQQLQAQAAKEQLDVERLEGLSLTGLFYSFIGSKEDRLRTERQEALAARLKCDEAAARLRTLEQEIFDTSGAIQQLADTPRQYAELLKAKEAMMAEGQGAADLFRLSEQEQAKRWELQQLEEALTAGRGAADALVSVSGALESAHNWGTWDLLGGGLISDMIKHSRIDEAQGYVYEAQQALAAFRRELKDVKLDVTVENVRLDSFTRFADIFFDGLIADWAVQSRINQSLESVRQNQAQVDRLLDLLDQRIEEAKTALAAAQRERQRFVTEFHG
ncbi:MAG: hypothetical protein ACM3XM_18865 [Mycobacterium leprae]